MPSLKKQNMKRRKRKEEKEKRKPWGG